VTGQRSEEQDICHEISVVIPVYQGEATLPALLKELSRFFVPTSSPDGNSFQIAEVILVNDNGPDGSAATIRELDGIYSVVRPIWLSRNFGQHAATLAGMASSGGDWIVTMDEDGQHDPADIPRLLDTAMREQTSLVYARATNAPPHGRLRNAASALTQRLSKRLLGEGNSFSFHSYRMVLGEIGRSVAAYAGSGVFLDVAIAWVSPRSSTCPVEVRLEGDRRSGYSMRRLLSHFWRMVLSSGTRALRVVSAIGVTFALAGFVLACAVVIARLAGRVTVEGWASVMVVLLIGIGLVLFALGVIAEYIGVAVNMAMGKPLYLIVSDPLDGPLGRAHAARDQ
jgi:glycosyltransferase involved in cell wall biosynthesis